MSENPFAGATRDPIALLEQLIGQVGGLKSHMDVIRQELKEEIGLVRQELKEEIGLVRQELKEEIGLVRQELKTIAGRQSALEGAFEQFRHETAAQLDRVEGIFGHVAKKWMEHDEEISRLKRRQG